MKETEHDLTPSQEAPEGAWISKRVIITEMPSKEVLEDFLMGLGLGPVGVCFDRTTGKFSRVSTRKDFWEERVRLNEQSRAYAESNMPILKGIIDYD